MYAGRLRCFFLSFFFCIATARWSALFSIDLGSKHAIMSNSLEEKLRAIRIEIGLRSEELQRVDNELQDCRSNRMKISERTNAARRVLAERETLNSCHHDTEAESLLQERDVLAAVIMRIQARKGSVERQLKEMLFRNEHLTSEISRAEKAFKTVRDKVAQASAGLRASELNSRSVDHDTECTAERLRTTQRRLDVLSRRASHIRDEFSGSMELRAKTANESLAIAAEEDTLMAQIRHLVQVNRQLIGWISAHKGGVSSPQSVSMPVEDMDASQEKVPNRAAELRLMEEYAASVKSLLCTTDSHSP